MCGIAGYFLKEPAENFACGDEMFGPIRQRGPDDEGVSLISRKDRKIKVYSTEKTVPALGAVLPRVQDKGSVIRHDIAFIHSRYAIIDLTEGGHQPFISRDGSIAAVFNGEIYNYLELKEELLSLGVVFRTTSDTEVLVEGYRVWGEDLWAMMNGFWAVVLYDLNDDSVVFSRDRIGVAPLYYKETPEGVFFASYIEPLARIGEKNGGFDEDVLLGFLQTGIKDHDNTTYYPGVKSFPAATAVRFAPGVFSFGDAKKKRYWDLPGERLRATDISFDEAVRRFRETFFNSVKLRLRSDVKVAFELSGGLDSSSVVAAAALLGDKNITTYTAKIKGADEEPYARSLLGKYKVDYHVLTDIEEDFSKDYGTFSEIMEEPYDNPNDYTHYMMLREIKRKGAHVVVTGAGGDEVFAGYEASFWPAAYREMKRAGSASFWLADWYEFSRRFKTLENSFETLSHYAAVPFRFVRGKGRSRPGEVSECRVTSAARYSEKYGSLSFHERALYHFNVALIPYYMRSSDHFTMGIPVEHRFPFLDYRMVELGLRMPVPYLFHGGWTKYILRKAMEPYLPGKIIWRRRKMGFAFPYRKYFSEKAGVFEPLMTELAKVGVPVGEFGSYEELLRYDPHLLWRLLSTAIWVKHNLKR